MKTRLLALLASGAALAMGCAPRYLPGTEIRDTPDTRAIATLLETYRQDMEKRDAQAVLALTTPDYFDNSGTLDPADDIDRAGLEKRLAELKDLTDLRLLLTLRGIQVTKDGEAQVEVAFEQFYRVTTPNGLVARRDTDIHRMTLRKVDGKWLFTSGL
jgi:hypothetical protein